MINRIEDVDSYVKDVRETLIRNRIAEGFGGRIDVEKFIYRVCDVGRD